MALSRFMPNLLNLILIPGALAAIFAYLLTPIVIKFAKRLGIIDDPAKNKHPKVTHTYPIPRGGGLAVFGAILTTAIIFLPLDKHLKGILGGAIVVVVLGFLDDKYNLNPYLRLVINFLAAAIPIAAGVGIAHIANPLGGMIDLTNPQINFTLLGEARSIWLLSDLFALFWIVFVMNMLNIGAKGIDGQLTGVVVIAAATIALLSLKFSADITQWPVATLAGVVMGAFFGFLPWHIYPQKIMPGYGGATLAGYFLAILSILSTAKVGTLMVVLGVPLIDTGYVVLRRILKGQSPVWGDRSHLHHKLLDSGWTKSKVTLFYWMATAVLAILALNLNTIPKLYTMIGVSIFVGGLILWLTYKPK